MQKLPALEYSACAQEELQFYLERRGQPYSGRKAVLAERLHSVLQRERRQLLSEQGAARDGLHPQYTSRLPIWSVQFRSARHAMPLAGKKLILWKRYR